MAPAPPPPLGRIDGLTSLDIPRCEWRVKNDRVSTERIGGTTDIAPGDIAINPLVLGSWFALLAGLADVFLYLVTRLVLHRYMHLSPQVVWIAPVSNLFLFGLPALVLLALARWRPARQWLFPSAMVFAFLMAWELSWYATRIHPLAALVLALGIAVQTARVVAGHPRGMRRVVRSTLPVMAALVAVAGLGHNSWRRLSELRTVAELPPAAQGAPNVLLIILDTVRALNLSLYGYPRQTSPALDRFARRGVVFDRAISASPWTLPSHATLFTGRWPHELNADWRVPLDAAYPTVAEVLAQRGYATAGFVANAHNAGRESGLARGFHHYEDFRISAGSILL
nr:sulfatase-like hydrolase/transferase [Gemmatimonadota bacterium]